MKFLKSIFKRPLNEKIDAKKREYFEKDEEEEEENQSVAGYSGNNNQPVRIHEIIVNHLTFIYFNSNHKELETQILLKILRRSENVNKHDLKQDKLSMQLENGISLLQTMIIQKMKRLKFNAIESTRMKIKLKLFIIIGAIWLQESKIEVYSIKIFINPK